MGRATTGKQTHRCLQTLNGLSTLLELVPQRVIVHVLGEREQQCNHYRNLPLALKEVTAPKLSSSVSSLPDNAQSCYLREIKLHLYGFRGTSHLWFRPSPSGQCAALSSVLGPSRSVKQSLHQVHLRHQHIQLTIGTDTSLHKDCQCLVTVASSIHQR